MANLDGLTPYDGTILAVQCSKAYATPTIVRTYTAVSIIPAQ